MKNKNEGERWIKQGERDIKAAKELLNSELFELACFHSQQAAEKILKGLLYWKGYRGIITHSVRELFNAVKDEFEDIAPLDKACIELDKQYIGSRYPDAFPSGSPYMYYTKDDKFTSFIYFKGKL